MYAFFSCEIAENKLSISIWSPEEIEELLEHAREFRSQVDDSWMIP